MFNKCEYKGCKYRASFKGRSPKKMKPKHILFGISMHDKSKDLKNKHKNDYFTSTIDLLLKITSLEKVTFLVADFLARHNKDGSINKTKEQQALEAGENWLKSKETKEGIKRLKDNNIEINILRWKNEECYGEKGESNLYQSNKQAIDEWCKITSNMKKVTNMAKTFVSRNWPKLRTDNPEYKQRLNNAIIYVKEEFNVLRSLGLTGKYDYFAYPNKETAAMQQMRIEHITPEWSNKFKWLELTFKPVRKRTNSHKKVLIHKCTMTDMDKNFKKAQKEFEKKEQQRPKSLLTPRGDKKSNPIQFFKEIQNDVKKLNKKPTITPTNTEKPKIPPLNLNQRDPNQRKRSKSNATPAVTPQPSNLTERLTQTCHEKGSKNGQRKYELYQKMTSPDFMATFFNKTTKDGVENFWYMLKMLGNRNKHPFDNKVSSTKQLMPN